MEKKRLTIGLIVANLEDVFSNQVCKGAVPAAEEIDANLVIFPGKYIDSNIIQDKGVEYEYQHNTLFSYAMKENVDLIVACMGDSAMTLSQSKKEEMLKTYTGIPILTIASRVGGHDFVSFDNETGLREGIEYLIKSLGKQKIGFVAGPLTNEDADARLDVYKRVLQENNIPIEERKIVHGNFTYWSEDAVRKLLDDNDDLEAVVFSNDHMAVAGYNVFRERGIEVGKDISVIGFDDSEFAIRMTPNLSTVRADAEELGYRAIKEGYAILCGEKKRNPYINSKFILRNSCQEGPSDAGELEKLIGRKFSSEDNFDEIVKGINSFLFDQFEGDKKIQSIKNELAQVLELVVDIFITEKEDISKTEDLRRYFYELLNENILIHTELDKAFHIMDIFYNILFSKIKREDKKILLSSVFAEGYRKIAYKMAATSLNYQSTLQDLNNITNTITRDMISFDKGENESYGVILEKMKLLNIESSYLYMFEKPIKHQRNQIWKAPEYTYLKTYQRGEDVFIQPEKAQKMKTNNIFHNAYLPRNRRYTLVLSTLFSNDEQFGLFLCEYRPEYYHYVEKLTYQISAAIKVIYLLQTRDKMVEKLEESFLKIKESNKKLDTISKSDELTGLLNRRGFLRNAEQMITAQENQGKCAVVFYADMDNLKIINDSFGHDDGDFALENIGEILKNSFRSNDIIGRIGGDEFAAIMILEHGNNIDSVKMRIKDISDDLNERCAKPYYIRLTVGTYEFICNNDIQIQDVLEKADVNLYEEKRHKDRNVLKR
ncbi:MAG: GGDEF domain-containing protein [Lachnospiraceae bacterium]|nr:GGDEF domain-containing protein [Lachnospiraceae bacterium]